MVTSLFAIAGLAVAANAPGGAFTVNPDAGNDTMSAVFDAPLGERIDAVSSAVGCQLAFRPDGRSVVGRCSVPLTSIQVDSEPTKTEHFEQWATHQDMEPSACTLEAEIVSAKLSGPLAAGQPVPFSAKVRFTICKRPRADGGLEDLRGTALLFPAGSYGKDTTVRLRGAIAGFDREAYGVSPKDTPGWLARVQMLAPVVAAKGDVELNLFAKQAAH